MLPFDPLPTLSKFGERSDRYVGYKLCSSPLGGYLEAQIPRGYPQLDPRLAAALSARESAARRERISCCLLSAAAASLSASTIC